MEKEGYEGEKLAVFSIAMKALSEYNTTVTGDSGEDGEQYLQLARIALPDCLREDEANFLSTVGLLDCTNIGDGFSSGTKICPGTCGFNFAGLFYSQMVSKIYFILFVCIFFWCSTNNCIIYAFSVFYKISFSFMQIFFQYLFVLN